ncbi:hypothetical protein Pfo_008260 [Paulownia fortunei]|nr:hypothetical protein Pfo_008260 [Paulownia fortunei]
MVHGKSGTSASFPFLFSLFSIFLFSGFCHMCGITHIIRAFNILKGFKSQILLPHFLAILIVSRKTLTRLLSFCSFCLILHSCLKKNKNTCNRILTTLNASKLSYIFYYFSL